MHRSHPFFTNMPHQTENHKVLRNLNSLEIKVVERVHFMKVENLRYLNKYFLEKKIKAYINRE
jgi:hypothetical protein